jgi:putative SOS response-associated peptidase YedK
MCTQFTPTRNTRWVHEHLGVHLPAQDYPVETFPGYIAPFVLLDAQRNILCTLARFGLIPHWARDTKAAGQIGRRTYNARSETVSEKPSYRTAWRRGQFGIALLDDFFEPNWESGRAERWRMRRADGQPMGVASLWDRWTHPLSGEIVTSFTLLTVHAEGHPVMGRLHRPGEEKRSVVVLATTEFVDWITAAHSCADRYLQRPSDGLLVAEPAYSVAGDPGQPAQLDFFQ